MLGRLWVILLLVLIGCGDPDLVQVAPFPQFGDFQNEVEVDVLGYVGNAMEPFISRDGQFLFFNNSGQDSIDMDIHYARKVTDISFEYLGRLDGANTTELEGVPTMDQNGDFYMTSLRTYLSDFQSLYGGRFSGTDLSSPISIDQNLSLNELGFINFDSEVSKDGQTLYFATGKFEGDNFPVEADIHLAQKQNGQFVRVNNSDQILANVNSDFLEYAPSISSDGLELFFNRSNINAVPPSLTIWQTKRTDLSLPFELPSQIEAIQGLQTEGASITDDGLILYFHKFQNGRFRLFKVSRSVEK